MLARGFQIRHLARVRVAVRPLRPHRQPSLLLHCLPGSLQRGLQLLLERHGVVGRHLGRLVLVAQDLHYGIHLCRLCCLKECRKVIQVPV